MFNLAKKWSLHPDGSNPCRHVEKYKEKSRERFLNAEELKQLGQALQNGLAAQTETPHMVAAIQLLLLTGVTPIYLSVVAIKVLELLQALPQASTTQRYAHVEVNPALNAANKIGAIVSNALKLDG